MKLDFFLFEFINMPFKVLGHTLSNRGPFLVWFETPQGAEIKVKWI